MVAGSDNRNTKSEQDIGFILCDAFAVAYIFAVNDNKVAIMLFFDGEEIFTDVIIARKSYNVADK
jgi:hypothetical protein